MAVDERFTRMEAEEHVGDEEGQEVREQPPCISRAANHSAAQPTRPCPTGLPFSWLSVALSIIVISLFNRPKLSATVRRSTCGCVRPVGYSAPPGE